MQKISLLFSFVFLIYIPVIANAEIKTITVTQSYKMGDNDSPNEARHICSIETRKSALEQALIYAGTLNAVKHYHLSKAEIKAYTSAALKIKTTNQAWLDMVLTIIATTDVDTDYFEKLISRIKSDQTLQNKFKEQQQKKEELEQALVPLQKKLKLASLIEAEDLRKERNATIREIDAIDAERTEIIEGIIKRSLEAKKRITVKMTIKDVESLLGKSDAQTYENYPLHNGKTYYVWYYGYTKLYFDGINVTIID
jgi:hypothetical protein